MKENILPSLYNFEHIENVKKVWGRHWKILSNESKELKSLHSRIKSQVSERVKNFTGVKNEAISQNKIRFNENLSQVQKQITQSEYKFYLSITKNDLFSKLHHYLPEILNLDNNYVTLANFLNKDNKHGNEIQCSVVKLEIITDLNSLNTDDDKQQMEELGFLFNEAKIVDSQGHFLKYATSDSDLYKNERTKDKWPGYEEVLQDAFGSFQTSDFNNDHKEQFLIDTINGFINTIENFANEYEKICEKQNEYVLDSISIIFYVNYDHRKFDQKFLSPKLVLSDSNGEKISRHKNVAKVLKDNLKTFLQKLDDVVSKQGIDSLMKDFSKKVMVF